MATTPPSPPSPSSHDLPQPPFIPIEGLPNFRDAGGYPISSPSSPSEQHMMIRRGVLYRASEPSKLTPAGEAQLRELGISEVYDLRSALEINRGIREGHGWAVKEWDGARRNFVPVFLDQDYSPEALALRIRNYSDETTAGFIAAYMNILHAAVSKDNQFSPFRTILAHLAAPPKSSTPAHIPSSSHPPTLSSSKPQETATEGSATTASTAETSLAHPSPVLIHCTAGKDRTGVIVALVLSLCGVSDDIIAHEYSLTEIGLVSRHEELMRHLLNNPSLKGDLKRVRRMIGAQKSSMLGTLSLIREKYNSVEGCVSTLGLLSPQEIAQLRANLVVVADADIYQPPPGHA